MQTTARLRYVNQCRQAMARSPDRSAQITVRCPPAFKAGAEHAAHLDSRSLSSLVEKLLTDHMRALGIDPENPPGWKPPSG